MESSKKLHITVKVEFDLWWYPYKDAPEQAVEEIERIFRAVRIEELVYPLNLAINPTTEVTASVEE